MLNYQRVALFFPIKICCFPPPPQSSHTGFAAARVPGSCRDQNCGDGWLIMALSLTGKPQMVFLCSLMNFTRKSIDLFGYWHQYPYFIEMYSKSHHFLLLQPSHFGHSTLRLTAIDTLAAGTSDSRCTSCTTPTSGKWQPQLDGNRSKPWGLLTKLVDGGSSCGIP